MIGFVSYSFLAACDFGGYLQGAFCLGEVLSFIGRGPGRPQIA